MHLYAAYLLCLSDDDVVVTKIIFHVIVLTTSMKVLIIRVPSYFLAYLGTFAGNKVLSTR